MRMMRMTVMRATMMIRTVTMVVRTVTMVVRTGTMVVRTGTILILIDEQMMQGLNLLSCMVAAHT